MNLRHIDPRSSDWMDAMLEGEGGRTRKREPQEEAAAAEPSENPALLLGAEAGDKSPQSPRLLRR
jgi:hypothetical protein